MFELLDKMLHLKDELIQIMDEVKSKHIHLIITKRNIPVAELIPIGTKKRPYFGWMNGTIEITGDIISPIDEEWDAAR